MKSDLIREKLHKQIDRLPDSLVEQIADFTLFLAAKNKATNLYEDWEEQHWQDLSLEQFFRDGDEVIYTLKDAREIYHP